MGLTNKNAQDEAKRLFDFLWENRGRKIILGQHTQTMEQAELAFIREVTGELPALCGFELLYNPCPIKMHNTPAFRVLRQVPH